MNSNVYTDDVFLLLQNSPCLNFFPGVCVFMRNNGTHFSIGVICVVHLQYNNVRGVYVRGVDIAYYPM